MNLFDEKTYGDLVEKVKQRVGGYNDVVDFLMSIINHAFSYRRSVHGTYIVHGGSGSGKTHLVKSILEVLPVKSKYLNCATIGMPHVGESERFISSLFDFLDAHSHTVLVLDNFDLLVPSHSYCSTPTQARISHFVVSALKKRHAANGVHILPSNSSYSLILCIVSTAQLDRLMSDVCCSDCTDGIIAMPPLDVSRRYNMIEMMLGRCNSIEKQPEALGEVLKMLSERSASFSAADISRLCSDILLCVEKTPSISLRTIASQVLEGMDASSLRQLRVVHSVDTIRFSSLYGVDSQIAQIRNHLLTPLLHPSIYAAYGLQPPSGALFVGPSGTGKSAMIEAMANEMSNQIHFIRVTCTDILSMFVGDSEKKLSEQFSLARQAGSCVLFLDRIESIAKPRGDDTTTNKSFDRLLSCLLTEIDGIFSQSMAHVLVIGSTHSLDDIDPSLARAGRLEEHVFFSLPSLKDRISIAKSFLQSLPLQITESDAMSMSDFIGEHTDGRSVADIKGVIQNAVLLAMKDGEQMSRVDLSHVQQSIRQMSVWN